MHVHPLQRLLARIRALSACAAACLLTTTALLGAPPAHANSAEEYRLKAAFLYNFASFTDWPATVGNTLAFCVYGDDPFGTHLDTLVASPIGTRRITVHRVRSVDAMPHCNLVYVSPTMIGNLPRLLDKLGKSSTLIVTDSPGALHQGAMLNMSTAAGKVTFAANLAAARHQGLGLSARLLRLATEVIQ